MLLVEDDRATYTALRTLLALKGWQVDLATTVADALAALDPPPAWIILDLMLPDGNGLSVLQAVRSRRLGCRVAVTTGSNDPTVLNAVWGLGPEILLRKPIDLPELLRGVGGSH